MKSILIVEDDKQYRTILKDELVHNGYTVYLAENGIVALESVKQQHVDLIILDLLMPELDGFGFYHQLKNKLNLKIPILVLTNVASSAAYDPDIIKDILIKSNTPLSGVLERVKELI